MFGRFPVGIHPEDVDDRKAGVFRVVVGEVQKIDVRPYVVTERDDAVDDDAGPRSLRCEPREPVCKPLPPLWAGISFFTL